MSVYADNASTTRISDSVLKGMLPYLTEHYGNPSNIYGLGAEAKKAVEEARQKVARGIGAETNEIFFTSGGSESDNWAIKGVAGAFAKKGKNHIVSTTFEHHAVLETLDALKKNGIDVTLVGVGSDGLVNPEDIKKAIRPETCLVTVIFANNEIGTLQPIAEIGAICKAAGVIFHTDAVQAVGHVAIDVKKMNIDLLSMSAHKLYGPKGVGALYCRKGLRFDNLINGGAQEKNRRAGTENVAGIVGFGIAIEEACGDMEAEGKRFAALRDRLLDNILKIERVRLNGDRARRLPGNANFSIEGIEGESLLLLLDMNGVCAATGSACASGSLDPSHVLLAIGLPHEIAHGSLRFTFGRYSTAEDADKIVAVLPGIIDRLRAMSPVWEKIKKEEK